MRSARTILTALSIAGVSALAGVPGRAPPAVLAQEVIRIRPLSAAGGGASPGRLALEEVLVIGSLAGEHDAFGRVMDVAVDRNGRIFIADDVAHHIKVFTADGAYEATIGRRGQGPGEFSAPWHVAVDPSDSLFVWDSGHSRILVFTPGLEYARSFVTPPSKTINSIVFDASGKLVLAAYGRREERGVLVLDRDGRQPRAAGPRIEYVDLAGFEDSLLGGELGASGGGFVYARKSPVEITILDGALQPLTTCRGDRSWTTDPATAVERTDRGAALRWSRYTHVVSVVALAGGNLLHTILDRASDGTKVQVLTPTCELIQTIEFPDPVIPADRRGDLLYAKRSGDYPEVVVYRAVWRR